MEEREVRMSSKRDGRTGSGEWALVWHIRLRRSAFEALLRKKPLWFTKMQPVCHALILLRPSKCSEQKESSSP